MGQVDLRSDTVTQPTPGMRRAMAEARVGDDVFGEDPTVIELEEMAAGRTGKEASLLVASGTMANLVCQLSHCQRGDEMILGDQSHMFYYEQGGSSALGGIHPHTVPNQPDGRLSEEAVENAVRADDVHFPVTRLIALENTHNRCSGSPLSPEYTHAVGEIARRNGLALHIDGARIFNAAISLGVPVRDLTADADSVSFCLSKGLCAPVGSLVCGSREFVNRARRIRKVLGGGMRQAGVLAAAGIVALDEMVDRLAEDHDNARYLADGLAGISGLQIDPDLVRTNIVFIGITGGNRSAGTIVRALEKEGVRTLAVGPYKIRAVTHYPIQKENIDHTIDAFARVMKTHA